MFFTRVALLSSCLALAACGGGGGGSASGGSVTPPAMPRVTGDMMAMSANKGWNYQGTLNGNPVTVSLYMDPTIVAGNTMVLAGTAQLGSVATVLSSRSNAIANEIGGLGIQRSTDGYHVTVEVSTGGAGLVPGAPLLVPADITQGQTWNPSPGATVTATLVGSVHGMAACPGATSGAELRYTYTGGYDSTIAYVPGCGITYFANNTNGQSLTLVSTGIYPSIGDLSAARRVATTDWMVTARTALGLNHTPMPAAALLRPLF